MKILQVSTPFLPVGTDLDYGGSERIVYFLDRELEARGYDSYVAAPATSKPRGHLYPTIEREVGVSGVLDKEGGSEFEGLNYRLEHIAESLKYANAGFDVVHIHDDNMLPFIGFIRAPSVMTLHSDYGGGFWNSTLHPGMTEVDAHMVAISDSQRRIYKSAGYNIDHVIYNGIDVDSFNATAPKMNYLLTLGTILPQKGQHNAIEVGRRLGTDVILAGNVGNPRYYEERVRPSITHDISDAQDKLAEYIALEKSQVGPKVVYTGPVNDVQKRPLYARAMAFLMPIEWEEPFGLVMAESMASGTPVIAYNRGAVPEIVVDGKTGYIVDNIDDMVRAVDYAGKIRAEDCRQNAEKRFSVSRMADDYLNLYDALS